MAEWPSTTCRKVALHARRHFAKSRGGFPCRTLGDRSQLITMTYVLRYRWWVVLTGVAVAAFMVHGVSVTIGHFLGTAVPARPMAFASAIAFLIFAVWAWREGAGADESVSTAPEPRFALLTVVSSFALAEMSDKTTLATVTLASDHNWAGVWIGTTLGMGRPTVWRLGWGCCCISAFRSGYCTFWPACCS